MAQPLTRHWPCLCDWRQARAGRGCSGRELGHLFFWLLGTKNIYLIPHDCIAALRGSLRGRRVLRVLPVNTVIPETDYPQEVLLGDRVPGAEHAIVGIPGGMPVPDPLFHVQVDEDLCMGDKPGDTTTVRRDESKMVICTIEDKSSRNQSLFPKWSLHA